MNTYQKGSVRTIIFKDNNVWVGVALEFNIVETGDDPREVFLMLDEAIRGYVMSAKKSKIWQSVLNQVPEKEYEDLWKKLNSSKPVKSPYQIHSFGERIIS
jgi:predicted RNase H-like HicB family nuclease